MNEEANFCSQCGATVNLDAKFCSNCGHDLKNSSTKTPPDENTRDTLKQFFSIEVTVISLILISVAGFFIIMAVNNREPLTEPDRIDKEWRMRAQDLELKIKTAQAEPNNDLEWEVLGEADPASRKQIGRTAFIKLKDDFCSISVSSPLVGAPATFFKCSFKFRKNFHSIRFKFDDDSNIYTMDTIFYGSGEVYVEPAQPLSYAEKTRRSLDAGLNPKITYEYEISYDRFIKNLRSAKAVAIGIFPIDLGLVWIRFSLKGAKEAIAKLGKELETAPNISND